MGYGVKCDCQGCKDRTVTCHSTCEKYENFLIRKEEYKKKYREDVNSRLLASGGWCYDYRAINSKR